MSLATIIAELKDTTIGKTLVKEREGASDQKRAALAEELAKLGAAAEKRIAPLAAKRKAALSRVAEARAELERLQLEALAADQALTGAVHAAEAREARLRGELTALAPAELKKFGVFLGRLGEELRVHPAPWGEQRPALLALLDAVRAARDETEELAESGEPVAQVRLKLEGRVKALRSMANGLARHLPELGSWE